MPTQKTSISVSSSERSVTVIPGQKLEFADDLSTARFMRPDPSENGKNPDLHVTFDDGGTLVLKDFFAASEEGGQGLPTLKLADGTEIAGGDFLRAFDPAFDLDTAAGPSAQADGSGLNEAAAVPGMTISGVETLGSLGTSRWSTGENDGGSGEGFTATTLAAAGLPGGGDAGNPGAGGGDGGNTGGGGGNEEQEKDHSNYRAVIHAGRTEGNEEMSLTSIEVPLDINGQPLTGEEIRSLLAGNWGVFGKDGSDLLKDGAFSFEVTEGSIIFTPNYGNYNPDTENSLILEEILEQGFTISIPDPLGGDNWTIPVEYEDDGMATMHLSSPGSRGGGEFDHDNYYISAGKHTDIHVDTGDNGEGLYVSLDFVNDDLDPDSGKDVDLTALSAADGGTLTITGSGVETVVIAQGVFGELRGIVAEGADSRIDITSQSDVSTWVDASGTANVTGITASQGGHIGIRSEEGQVLLDNINNDGNATAALVKDGSTLELYGNDFAGGAEGARDSRGIIVSDDSTLTMNFTAGADLQAGDAWWLQAVEAVEKATGLSLDGNSTAGITVGDSFTVGATAQGDASAVEVKNGSTLNATIGSGMEFDATSFEGGNTSALTVQGSTVTVVGTEEEYGLTLSAFSYDFSGEAASPGEAKALEMTDDSSLTAHDAGHVDFEAHSDNGGAFGALVKEGSVLDLSGNSYHAGASSSGESRALTASQSELELNFKESVDLAAITDTAIATALSLDDSTATITAGGDFSAEAYATTGYAAAVEVKNGSTLDASAEETAYLLATGSEGSTVSALTVQEGSTATLSAAGAAEYIRDTPPISVGLSAVSTLPDDVSYDDAPRSHANALEVTGGSEVTIESSNQDGAMLYMSALADKGDASAALVKDSGLTLSGSVLESVVYGSGNSQGIIASGSALDLDFTESVHLQTGSRHPFDESQERSETATGLSLDNSTANLAIGTALMVEAYATGDVTAIAIKNNSDVLDATFGESVDVIATSEAGGNVSALTVQNGSRFDLSVAAGAEEDAGMQFYAWSHGPSADGALTQAKSLEATNGSAVTLAGRDATFEAVTDSGDAYALDARGAGVAINMHESVNIGASARGASGGDAYGVNAVGGSVDITVTSDDGFISGGADSGDNGRATFINAEGATVTLAAAGGDSFLQAEALSGAGGDASLVDASGGAAVTVRAGAMALNVSAGAAGAGLTAEGGSTITVEAQKELEFTVSAEQGAAQLAHASGADSVITIKGRMDGEGEEGEEHVKLTATSQEGAAGLLLAENGAAIDLESGGDLILEANAGAGLDPANAYGAIASGHNETTSARSDITIEAGGNLMLWADTEADGSTAHGLSAQGGGKVTATIAGETEIEASAAGLTGYGYALHAEGPGSEVLLTGSGGSMHIYGSGETGGAALWADNGGAITVNGSGEIHLVGSSHGMYADQGSTNTFNGSGEIHLVGSSHGMYAGEGSTNTINGILGESGITVAITAESDVIENAYAMYADGPGAKNIVNGTELADRISIAGRIEAEGGGRNEINTGEGDDVIILKSGAAVGAGDLHLDAGAGHDTLILHAETFDEFKENFGEWLQSSFSGMDVEAVHVSLGAGNDLFALQEYFANSVFDGASLTFSQAGDNGSVLNLDALVGKDEDSTLADLLDTLGDESGPVSSISLEGAKDNALTIDAWHDSMQDGLTIDGGESDSITLGSGWSAGESSNGYTTYTDNNNHSIQVNSEIAITLLSDFGG